ncbi:unnamed protein product [Rhizoctonia solani]|uniref:Uncharacterized protein n=1 Tax=Rhizoctonia solani TaxID=456999 RepID=A0A8H2W945_9AGAM|nr:unnamed protein product [Rhizoctonia solani]
MSDPKLDECPHCGMFLGKQQIWRHIQLYRSVQQPDLDSSFNLGPDSENLAASEDIHEPNQLVGNTTIMDRLLGKTVGEAMANLEDTSMEPPPQDIANTTLGDETASIQPAPLRRNPPVTIEEWPDPEDNFTYSEASSDEDLPVEPEFVERKEPLGAWPKDKAQMNDNKLIEFLEEHLGDAVEEEWFKTMYNRKLGEGEYRTLQLLATWIQTHFSQQIYKEL